MKITTWNVNSIRTRLEHVTDWLDANPVDVLCVQETKVQDKQFPLDTFRDRNLQVEFFGQKSYNGVALISQEPLTDVSRGFSAVLGESVAEWDEQKRVITGKLGDVQVVNLYVPNGSAIASDKYDYKLGWLTVLKDYLAKLLEDSPKLCVCGDFNIALENHRKGRQQYHGVGCRAGSIAIGAGIGTAGFLPKIYRRGRPL